MKIWWLTVKCSAKKITAQSCRNSYFFMVALLTLFGAVLLKNVSSNVEETFDRIEQRNIVNEDKKFIYLTNILL